jgi:tetratricopeptide (TPR) repeat protein
MPRALFRTLLALCASAVLRSVSAADPPPKDPAGAEKLFAEARNLLEAGKYAEACQKLADSHQLDPAVGTLLNLAQCYVKLGKTATAWATYREAAAAAKAAGQAEREKKANRAAEALEPDLPKCTITVPDEAAQKGIEVRRNGMVVPKSLWSVTEPLDPGEYLIEARVPGGGSWSKRIVVEPGRVAIVILPAFQDSPAPQGSGTATPVEGWPAGASAHVASTDASSGGLAVRSTATRKWAEYALLAVGAAGMTVGGIELVRFNSKNNDIVETCGSGPRCSSAQAYSTYPSLREDANSARVISYVSFAVGTTALGTALVLFLTEAPKSNRPTAVSLVPVVGRDGVAVAGLASW